MTRIDIERQNSQERSLYSANQSVESLVITANDGIKKSDSIPRTAPTTIKNQFSNLKGEQSENDRHDNIEDLDLLNSTEITASIEESSPPLKATSAEISDDRQTAREDDRNSVKNGGTVHRNREVQDGERVKPSKRSSGQLSNASKSSDRHSQKQSETTAQQRDSYKSSDIPGQDEGQRDFKRSGSVDEGKRRYSLGGSANVKPQDAVRFSKSENSVIPTEADNSTEQLSSAASLQQGGRMAAEEESGVDDWPASQELLPKKHSSGGERHQRVRLPPDSDEETAPLPKTRSRGKSDVGSIKGKSSRKQTGKKPSNFIDALDLEEMGSDKRSKIRRESHDDSEYGSKEFNRSPPQQKSKKAKHRGRVEPESDEPDGSQDENAYNSDGVSL